MKHFVKYFMILSALLLSACASTGGPVSPAQLQKAQERYEAKPDDTARVYKYAQSLASVGEPRRALDLMTMSKAPIEGKKILLFMAGLYKAVSMQNKQIETLETLLDIDPADLSVRKTLLAIYKKNENYAAAQRLYDEVLYCCDDVKFHEAEYVRWVDEASLNLIAQDLYKDAFDLTKMAKEKYPKNITIERNLRIIRALVQSHGHSAPKPEARPKYSHSI